MVKKRGGKTGEIRKRKKTQTKDGPDQTEQQLPW